MTTTERLAARAVALHAPGSLADKLELLDMLGLLTTSADIKSSLVSIDVAITKTDRHPARKNAQEHPELFTSPSALRNLPQSAAKR